MLQPAIDRRRGLQIYGKVFDSIYDGTLYGNWEAIATFQQFIVLANADGIVDMTPQAIAARTSFPLDLIQRGIKFLEAPDPYSRTPGEEGRRIILIDSHRPWGWKVVNHWKYRALRDQAQKRAADRERMEKKRKENNDVAIGRHPVADVAHADADAEANTEKKGGRAVALPDWLPKDSWDAWLEVRRKSRAPNTARALHLAITELAKLKAAGQDVQAVLEQSTLRGWRSVFAVKVDPNVVSALPKRRTCAYCPAPSTGSVNRFEHCREHESLAMDNVSPKARAA